MNLRRPDEAMTTTMTQDRHSRTRAAGYDPDRLHHAAVLVAGVGALGQNTALNLALLGIGELRIVDVDVFEDSNLPRSPLYRTTAAGGLKAPNVARALLDVATATAPVVRWSSRPLQDLGYGAVDGVDVIVSAVDNAAARAWLSDLAAFTGIHLVEGGFDARRVSLSTFPAGVDGACWRCGNPHLEGTFSCRFAAQQAEAAGVVPAIQTGAAALGALQAEAVAQALHGELPGPRSVHLDVGTGVSRIIELSRDPGCTGAHRRVEPGGVAVAPSDPAIRLVEAAERVLGEDAQVVLPQPWVDVAYCMTCRTPARANATEAAWRLDPRCSRCGGTAEPVEGGPVVVSAIGASAGAEVLERSCAELGLLERAVVEVIGADGPAVALRLQGDVGELFERAGS
jgi:molybdopterin/thiamine biosynthesis adenylyltransferase